MIYLTEEEIPKYCTFSDNVSMELVEAASVLIDAYKGCSFGSTDRVERVEISRRRTTNEQRGKLIHFPRIEITSIQAKLRGPFGVDTVTLPDSCIDFDSPDSPYFTFYMPRELMFRKAPDFLYVEYKSGYKEIPEAIKRACGLIACNISQMGGVLRWKSRDDYDIKVTLGNEGVMSSEVKQILNGVMVQ